MRITKRRYIPLLRQHHEVARYFFGTQHLQNRWDNWIDVDEKWFYVVSIKGFVWFLPDYMDPADMQLPVESKRYITKIMFLCAVAKPIYDPASGACLFDGKVR